MFLSVPAKQWKLEKKESLPLRRRKIPDGKNRHRLFALGTDNAQF